MNNHQDFPYNKLYPEEPTIDYRQLLKKYLSFWPWFVFSCVFSLCIGFLYGKYTIPMYKVSARVLVNDEEKGGGLSAATGVLGNLSGLLGTKSTVDNEAEVFKTKSLMGKVVRDLQLNITYYIKSGFRQEEEIYKAPFMIKCDGLVDGVKPSHVTVHMLTNDKVSLFGDKIDTVVNFNSNILLPELGYIEVRRNVGVPFGDDEYSFSIQSVRSKVTELESSLGVVVGNKQITIIDLTLDSPIPKKGEDILNCLIYNYVRENLRDKNEVADSTIAFINRRLMIIGSELGDAEGSIQSFKQKNNLADMSEQGKLLVTSSGQYVSELAKVETQISIVINILDYLKDSYKNKRVLPSALASPDLVFANAIEKYNGLLLERGRMLIGLSENNPIILNLDKEISNTRIDIESNLTSTLAGLKITKAKLNKQMEGAEGEIQRVPATERNYLRLARQQQIKQELFIFLMQKSEETAISKTANLANSKTIDPPQAEIKPYTPKRLNNYVFSLAFGLLMPFGIIYIKDLLNDKVQLKDDVLNHTQVSVVGEISHNQEGDNLVVSNSSRSAISEQFRSLRTNLAFYLKGKDEKVIMLTSSMSGEGKSFVAINLANIIALSGKTVCLMELDLRKPGLSTKLSMDNHLGFTNYIITPTLTFSDIIQQVAIHENVYLIPSGPIPPNPAEMLMNERTETLIADLKRNFDYIIVDAPPVGIVTDAELLSSSADLCLYLVRQGFTRKEQLIIVENLFKNKKMNSLGIVINDIKTSGFYGYGYGYGYGSYDN
jgi:tyrosine-protein kinase Etk/Wzc